MNRKSIYLLIGLIVLFIGGSLLYREGARRGALPDGSGSTSVSLEVSSSNGAVDDDSDESASSLSEADSQEASSSNSASSAQGIDQPVVDFTVINDLNQPVKLSDFKGKPVILNIWASWCPPCQREMPVFEEAIEKYKDQIEFLMVNATDSRPTETRQAARSFLEEAGLKMPIYYDQNYAVQMKFGTRALPTTIVFNAEHEMVAYRPGELNEAQLKELMEEVGVKSE